MHTPPRSIYIREWCNAARLLWGRMLAQGGKQRALIAIDESTMPTSRSYMASVLVRHQAAYSASAACTAGGGQSAEARSKCARPPP